MATKKTTEQSEGSAAFVQVDAVIGSVACKAGDVIEGVPAAVVAAYAGVIDPVPEAVEAAKDNGAAVKQYAD